MPLENEFRWSMICWLNELVENGIISEQEIAEIEEDLDNMGEPSGRADIAIGIMNGWISLNSMGGTKS